MQRKIFIGDTHGCLHTFKALLAKINFTKEDQLYLLGDYIDRGLDSKGVIDEIWRLQKAGYAIITLRGNHEQMLLSNYEMESIKGWHNMADTELLQSFGIPNLKTFPKEYIEFCDQLPFYHAEDDFILAHAGLNFAEGTPLEQTRDLIWIRNWYDSINYEWLGNKIIVHGHTPMTRPEIEDLFRILPETKVLNIDCGVFLSKRKEHGLGNLCAFDFTNQQLYFQENIEPRNNY